ncbi:hypothetical protein VUR80DRAFT_8421 [Thermomyces stellatus]
MSCWDGGRSPVGRHGVAGDRLGRRRLKEPHRSVTSEGSGRRSSSWPTNPIFFIWRFGGTASGRQHRECCADPEGPILASWLFPRGFASSNQIVSRELERSGAEAWRAPVGWRAARRNGISQSDLSQFVQERGICALFPPVARRIGGCGGNSDKSRVMTTTRST